MGAKKKKHTPKKQFWHQHVLLAKWLAGISCGLLVLVLATYLAFTLSPWPNSMIIRYGFEKNGAEAAKKMEKYVPTGIIQVENQQYRPNDKDGYLDVFYPENTTTPLPTVVWVHGGAWVSGDKNNVDNYLKIVASYGFTAVGVDYSIAPEHTYPLPLYQVNDALKYIQENAQRLHINDNSIVLAGDSAGSQIVAQVAALITTPSYVSEVGITPTLQKEKLKAMVLNCGAYDLALPDYNGPFGKFLHTVLWAYSGKKYFLTDPQLKQASVINYLTSDFPPSFITAGNDDPLENQSTELAARLAGLKVPTSTLFYPANHEPKLPHEYQFDLDINDGQQALKQMTDFLKQYAH